MLIGIFNSLNNHELTIVGKGPLESSLKKIASNNIVFTGNVDNHQLSQYYSGNNFLILPSISETWGLVVEEALYFGIPVLVSQNCGSSQLVINGENGFVFDPNNPFKLKELIISIDGSTYNEFQKHIKTDFIDSKDLTQVNTFLN